MVMLSRPFNFFLCRRSDTIRTMHRPHVWDLSIHQSKQARSSTRQEEEETCPPPAAFRSSSQSLRPSLPTDMRTMTMGTVIRILISTCL